MANLESIILKDSGGTEADVTASNALKVDGSAVTQPISGTVTINAIPAGTNAIGKLAANDGVDIGDVTINNAAGASAVNIQDGGNSITVDGTVAVSGTVTVGAHAVTNAGTFAVQDSEKIADNAGFTDGTTKVNPIGLIFDEVAGTALTENDIAAPRMDSKRAIILTIEDETTRGRRATVTAANAVKVDGSAVTQPVSISGNQATNIAQINGVTPLMGAGNTGTGSPRVTIATDQAVLPAGGNVAHDAVDSGNPVKTGGRAVSVLATATLVAAADRSDFVTDLDGAQIIRSAPLGDIKSDAISDTAGTSVASSVFTAVASTRNFITGIHVFRTDAGTSLIYVDFRDGTAGSVLWRVAIPAGGGAILPMGPLPYFKTTANTALAYDVSAAISTVYINVTGYQSKL